jgi:hypothetical protein
VDPPPPQVAEVPIPAEGMQDVEAMLESEAAATATGEDSLEEAGAGHGAAGRETLHPTAVLSGFNRSPD